MFVFSRVGDVVSAYIAMFLVPDVIGEEELGVVLPLIYMVPFLALPLNIVLRVALKYINVFAAAGENGKIRAMLHHLFLVGIAVTVLLIAVMLSANDFVQARLRFQSPWVLPLVIATAIASCWMPLFMTVCQALKQFNRIILTRVLGPVVRLAVVLLLLERFRIVGYLGGMLAMNLALVALLGSGLRRYLSVSPTGYRDDLASIGRYLVPIAVLMATSSLLQLVEPWVIRQRLPAVDSAGYYVAAMFGNIPLWVAPAMTPFLFPLVSERHERGECTRRMHLQSLGVVLLIGLSVAVALRYGGDLLLSLRSSWRQYADYAPYMWRQAVIATLTVFMSSHLLHETACRRFRCLAYYVPLMGGEAVLLYVLMGWGSMQGILPASWWECVDGWVQRDLGFILSIMLAGRILTALCICVEALFPRGTRRRSGGSA